MARFNSYDCSSGNSARLQQTTSFSTTGYTNVKVNFDWTKDDQYPSSIDSVYVQWSVDGTTWDRAGGVGRYQASGDSWTAQSISLPAGAGNQASLYIAFLFVSKYGNDCYLDNAVVTADLIPAYDLLVSQWNTPVTGSDVDPSDTVRITVSNNGTSDVSNFDIAYSVDGGNTFVTQNIPGTLTAGNDSMYTFTTSAALTVYTTYNCMAAVTLSGDGNHNNDTLTTNITKSMQLYTDTVYPQLQPLWTGTVCADSIVDSSYVETLSVDTLVGWMKFDISSIPDQAQIQSVTLHAYEDIDNYAYFRVMSLEYDPMANPYDTIYNDARNGSTYYQYAANFPDPGWFAGALGSTANSDFSNRLADDWFGVGIWEYETTGGYYAHFEGWNETNVPYIVVTYGFPLSVDVTVTGATSPTTGYFNSPSGIVTITVKNLGTDPVTEIPVSYTCNATTVNETTPVGDTLQMNDTYTYTFVQPLDVSVPGTYNVQASVAYSGDINPGNDTYNYSFVVWAPFYKKVIEYDVSALTASYGSEFYNGQFYISRWNSNQIYVLNNQGGLDTTLPVTVLTSAQGFRDLSTDGDYFYGGINATTLYRDSLASDTFYTVNSATTATYVRGIDYDPENDALWICNWTSGSENILLVDKNTGATIQTITNPNASLYGFGGLAYDYWTPGGPYIVGASQHNHNNQLVWIKISDGTVLVDHDITQDIPSAITAAASIGGAFCSDEAIPGSVVLGGVIQNFRLCGFEIVSTAIDTFSVPGQISATINDSLKEIHVDFPYNADMSNVVPEFELNDFHDLALAYVSGALQTSGVNTFSLNNGDTLVYHVVRMNYNNTDSVYTDWNVIINVLDTPSVTTDSATQVMLFSANLHGTVYPQGVNISDAKFRYGIASGVYTDSIAATPATASGITPVSFSASLSALTPNTTYYYLATATDGSLWFEGVELSFTTLDYTISINPATQSVSDAAGTIDYLITSNYNWTATSDQTWCTVTASGSGNDTLTADYQQNTTASSRTATIVVTAGTASDTATLIQGSSGIEEQGIYCLVYPNPSEGVFYLSVNGSYDLQVIDILGEIVFNDRITNDYVLDLNGHAAGSYVLRLISSDGSTLNYKLMIR
jgi:hypothetical protein